MRTRLCGLMALLAATSAAPSAKPHILYLLADDFGWQDADWHRADGNSDPLATPTMSELIKDGVELDLPTLPSKISGDPTVVVLTTDQVRPAGFELKTSIKVCFSLSIVLPLFARDSLFLASLARGSLKRRSNIASTGLMKWLHTRVIS